MNFLEEKMAKPKLRDLIHAVRQCRTAAQERSLVAKESAKIRTSFAKDNAENRQRNVAKLLYIHMLGYPSKFGQMECLKLISSQYFADKRIGYLGLMLLLDEKQEVLMLATHSLKKDLAHSNQYVVGLALCAIANISSEEIARDSAADVAKLMGSGSAYIRKKAALAAVRIVRKLPEMQENFTPKIRSLLSDSNHGVLVAACSLMIELMEKHRPNTRVFRAYVPGIVRILKAVACSGYSPEYDVHGVMDPFLQVKLLRVLRYLGHNSREASNQMNDILAQVATNTESERIVGNAILYECVQTIMFIKAEKGLRVLAINILGRFLSQRDNNIRYVALNTLNKVLSPDQTAIQRHRETIVECLKDPDISIRRRALDLVYNLVNTNNVRALVREMLTFLMNADVEFRADLGAKICLVTEKYAPNKKWHLDTIVRVLSIAGEYIRDDVVAGLIAMISQTEDLHTYAVQKMYLALNRGLLKQPLVQAALWCLGEYADILLSKGDAHGGEEIALSVSEDDIFTIFEKVDKHASTTPLTREFMVTACTKMIERNGNPAFQARAVGFLERFSSNYNLEIHERTNEYLNIIRFVEDPAGRSKILGPIPPPPAKKNFDEPSPARGGEGSAAPKSPAALSRPREKAPPAAEPEAPASSGGSLLDDLAVLSSGMGAPAGGSPMAPQVPAGGGEDLLSNIFGGAPTSTPVPVAGDALVPMNVGAVGGPGAGGVVQASPSVFPNAVVYDRNGISVEFSFQKNPNNVAHTLVTATLVNSSGIPAERVSFKISVPKYIKFQVAAPSGNSLPPMGQGNITVPIKLNNSLHGQKPILMRLRLEYTSNGQDLVETADVKNFPPGL